MKYLSLIILSFFSVSTFACSCFNETSFCNLINSNSFANNGIVCIVESTGNVTGDYNFSAAEVKIVDLLYGQVNPGSGNYLNTDSTIWIIAGQGATCYKSAFTFNNAGDQFVIASSYGEVYRFNDPNEEGYSLFLCSHDVFSYGDPMIGPIIHDYDFYSYTPFTLDTVTINQLPQVVNTCTSCPADLNLPGPHDFPLIYSASSTILSTANVSSNITYQAKDRITLFNGFKTNASNNFKVRIDDCN